MVKALNSTPIKKSKAARQSQEAPDENQVFFVGPEQLARFAVAFLRGTRDKSPDSSFTRSPIKNKRLLFLNQKTPIEISVFFLCRTALVANGAKIPSPSL